jgi:WD40 repeat protein/outer membrane lipoprotein-sorting protein
LRQIGLALLHYHDTQGGFPAWASYSKDGKPLLSWRVHLLPDLGELELYNQFHLNEPWDSEHNKRLIAQMPAVYRCPNQKSADKGKTTYLAPLGKDTMFTGDAKRVRLDSLPAQEGARFAEITVHTSNTISIVDAVDDHAVIWTKPADLKYDPGKPLTGLFGHHQELAAVLFADASVRFLRKTIDPKDLRVIFTRNGADKVLLRPADILIDDTAYLKEVRKPLALAETRVRDLLYSPDGSFMLLQYYVGDDVAGQAVWALGVWDTKTGQLQAQMEGNVVGGWSSIAISPDGKKAAAINVAAFDRSLEIWNVGTVKIWDVSTGKLTLEQALPEYKRSSDRGVALADAELLKFSADSAYLYSIWDNRILEAKLGGKTRLLALKLDGRSPGRRVWDETTQVTLDPDAKLLIVAANLIGEAAAELGFFHWAKKGEPRWIPTRGSVDSMALSQCGKTLAMCLAFPGEKPKLELWDVATFKRRTTLPVSPHRHFQGYRQLVFAPDGNRLAGVPTFTRHRRRVLDVFDLEGNTRREIAWPFEYSTLAFSPDGKTLAAAWESPIVFVDPATGARKNQQNEADKLFRAMEKKITETKALKVVALVETRGDAKEMAGSYKSLLLLANDNKARLKVSGVDFGEARQWEMVSNGKQVKLRPYSIGVPELSKEQATLPTPKNLHAYLATRVSRLGVFLTSPWGRPVFLFAEAAPDIGSDIWGFETGTAEKVGGRDAKVVRFKRNLTGIRSKDADFTVWIDSKTLLPLKRVIVPDTTSKGSITEIYEEFTLDPKIDAGAFELTFPVNDAEKLFLAMQEKIKAANAVQVAFDIQIKANGKQAKGKGSLLFTKENKAQFKMNMDEMGEKVATEAISDGKRMKFAKSPEVIAQAEADPSPRLLHSLLGTMVSGPGLWLTYEGDYLNAAAAGFFKSSVERMQLVSFETGAPEKVGGRDAKVITYALAGLPGAADYNVTLWIDAQTLLPLKRVIVPVHWESARITETCEFTLNPKIEAGAFELPK